MDRPPPALAARARLLAAARSFMADAGIMEVEVPLLGSATATDPHLQSIAAQGRWLQTSPELFMKRLLCAGCGPIYTITRAFRADECGADHNPEFSMLEWYMPGWGRARLARQVARLLEPLLGIARVRERSYGDCFAGVLGACAHSIGDAELARLATGRGCPPGLARPAMLDYLMGAVVLPQLRNGADELLIVDGFPACQAAMARLGRDGQGRQVALRFEVFCAGVELASGYDELCCAAEQRARFAADNEMRERCGRAAVPPDEALLAAMENPGLPPCAGVALGLDRLLAVQLGARVADVIAIPWGAA